MRIQLLAAALLLGTAIPAMAADAVVDEVVVVDSAYNWSGLYVGAQGGYAWGDSHWSDSIGYYHSDIDPDGFFGGIYAGYNYQFANNVVFGIDADINASGIDGSEDLRYGGGVDSFHALVGDVKYTAAVRARLGYAMDRWMPYIAGGLSVSEYEWSLVEDTGYVDFRNKETFTGWNIGVGAEYAFTDNVIFRGEYRYSDFGSYDAYESWTGNNTEVDLKTNDIRLGVAYKF